MFLKRVESSHENSGSYTEKYQDISFISFAKKKRKKKKNIYIYISFAYKVACVDNKFSKKVVLYREKNAAYRFIKAILNEYDYCKKMIKKAF